MSYMLAFGGTIFLFIVCPRSNFLKLKRITYFSLIYKLYNYVTNSPYLKLMLVHIIKMTVLQYNYMLTILHIVLSFLKFNEKQVLTLFPLSNIMQLGGGYLLNHDYWIRVICNSLILEAGEESQVEFKEGAQKFSTLKVEYHDYWIRVIITNTNSGYFVTMRYYNTI